MCLLTGCELKAGLSWKLKVVRCALAGGELVGLLLGGIFLYDARLGEVLYWDQPMHVCFLSRCQTGKGICIGIVCLRDLNDVVLVE